MGLSAQNLLYDATDLVAAYDAAGTTMQRRYVHAPGTDKPIVWSEGSGTTAKNWFYADHLGSIVATANAAGASTGIWIAGELHRRTSFFDPNLVVIQAATRSDRKSAVKILLRSGRPPKLRCGGVVLTAASPTSPNSS
ncbi:MAG TPA: hypothetical protein VJ832_04410 [Variovorax sp.]|nr:hypothetical protein [Variovorax sp.]